MAPSPGATMPLVAEECLAEAKAAAGEFKPLERYELLVEW